MTAGGWPSVLYLGPWAGLLAGVRDACPKPAAMWFETRGCLPDYDTIRSLAEANGLQPPSFVVSSLGGPRVAVDGTFRPDPTPLRAIMGQILQVGGVLAGPILTEDALPEVVAAELARQDPHLIVLTRPIQGARHQVIESFARSAPGLIRAYEDPDALGVAVRSYLQRSLADRGYAGIPSSSQSAAATEAVRRLAESATDVALVLVEADSATGFAVSAARADAVSCSLAAIDTIDLVAKTPDSGARPAPPAWPPSVSVGLASRLPLLVDPVELANTAANSLAEPWGYPHTSLDAEVASALAVELLGRLSRGWDTTAHADTNPARSRLLVGSGFGLARLGNPRRAAACLVEGLRPVGVTAVAIDPNCGALLRTAAAVKPTVPPATAVCVAPLRATGLSGTANRRAVAVVTVRRANGSETVRRLLPGQVSVLALPEDETVELDVEPCTRHTDFGRGPGNPWRGPVRVGEGGVGLILDGRERPAVPPLDLATAADRNRELLVSCGVSVGAGTVGHVGGATSAESAWECFSAGPVDIVRPLAPASKVKVCAGDLVDYRTVIGTVASPRRVLRLPVVANMELLKKPGQPVKRGEAVAVMQVFLGLGLRELVSPCDGIVDSINSQRTAVTIAGVELETLSLVPGRVALVEPRRVVIQATGRRLPGFFALGQPVAGELRRVSRLATQAEVRRRLGPEAAGCVLLVDSCLSADALPSLGAAGVVGVICGGLDFAPVWELIRQGGPHPSGRGLPSVVATEPFGSYEVSVAYLEALCSGEGRLVYLSGAQGDSTAGAAVGKISLARQPEPFVLLVGAGS